MPEEHPVSTRQARLIRSLIAELNETCVMPTSRKEASATIRRLMERKAKRRSQLGPGKPWGR